MNTLILTTLLLNLSPSKMLIQNYQPVPEMDYQIVLTVADPAKRVLVDCQSFINAIYYQSLVEDVWQNDWSLMLDGSQCEEVIEYAIMSLDAGNPFCFSVDRKERLVDVSSNVEKCTGTTATDLSL